MLICDLLETTETELAMNRQVHQAAMTVMHYIVGGNQPYAEVELEGQGDFYAYRAEDLGLDQHILLTIGLLMPNTIGMSGAIVEYEEPVLGGYQLGIKIHCMQHFTIEDLRSKVNTVGFMQAFEHEYLHILDRNRTAERIVTKARVDPRQDQAGYYNDPAEFNAYYHDIAKDMMGVINAAQQNPQQARDYLDLYHFTGDWKADLGRLLTKNYHVQRFVQALQPERRKALLRRLYRLYEQMLQTISASVSN